MKKVQWPRTGVEARVGLSAWGHPHTAPLRSLPAETLSEPACLKQAPLPCPLSCCISLHSIYLYLSISYLHIHLLSYSLLLEYKFYEEGF